MQPQINPRNAIEIEHSKKAGSKNCIEHPEEEQTAPHPTPLQGLPITRRTSMCASCFTQRLKLNNMRKRLQMLRVQVSQTKMETVKRLNEEKTCKYPSCELS